MGILALALDAALQPLLWTGELRPGSFLRRHGSLFGYIPAENLIGRAEFQTISTKDGAPVWQFWKWPDGIRFGRFLQPIH
jgi:signal peptidase I